MLKQLRSPGKVATPNKGKGKGQGGEAPGQHLMEVDLSLDELADILAEELKLMAGWLGLETVRVERKGDLAGALARAVG